MKMWRSSPIVNASTGLARCTTIARGSVPGTCARTSSGPAISHTATTDHTAIPAKPLLLTTSLEHEDQLGADGIDAATPRLVCPFVLGLHPEGGAFIAYDSIIDDDRRRMPSAFS